MWERCCHFMDTATGPPWEVDNNCCSRQLLRPKHVCADLSGHAATALLWMRAACTGLGDTERRQLLQSFRHR
jgi:hypothetical protein